MRVASMALEQLQPLTCPRGKSSGSRPWGWNGGPATSGCGWTCHALSFPMLALSLGEVELLGLRFFGCFKYL